MRRTHRAVLLGLIAALGFIVGMLVRRDGLEVENAFLLAIGFGCSVVVLLDDRRRGRCKPRATDRQTA